MSSNETFESIKLRTNLPRGFLQKSLRNLVAENVLSPIDELIKQAYELGLPLIDVENALINLEYNEPELAFDIVAEQMYEHGIKIDKRFCDLALEICQILQINNQNTAT